MIYVVATIEITDKRRTDLLELFRDLVPKVHGEPGCIAYTPTIDVETSLYAQPTVRPNCITVVEQWESIDALEKHLMTPHMLEFFGATKEIIASVAIQVLEPAGT